MATAIATNTLSKHAPDAAVFLDTTLRPRTSGLWNSAITSKVLCGFHQFLFAGLCNVWLEFISKDMCLCCYTGENGENTHAHAHPHFYSTAPQHCWYQTRLYGTPPHSYAQWQLAPAVAHCCKWEWATRRDLSLRHPNLQTERTTESTELSQAKTHRCNS